jgi:hypothetical protein
LLDASPLGTAKGGASALSAGKRIGPTSVTVMAFSLVAVVAAGLAGAAGIARGALCLSDLPAETPATAPTTSAGADQCKNLETISRQSPLFAETALPPWVAPATFSSLLGAASPGVSGEIEN